jgi:hypothetical protein
VAVYEPILPNVPPWLYERICSMGLTGAASMCRELAASATEDSDFTSADAFTMWTSVIENAGRYPGKASGRNSIMVLRKA